MAMYQVSKNASEKHKETASSPQSFPLKFWEQIEWEQIKITYWY